jgi:NADPH-dependent curcumin reductase CurA
LAKAAGCRVVGFAGGAHRCRWAIDNLGIDHCLDYQSSQLSEELRAAFPNGIDVFSDGVGGPLTELVVGAMNKHSRLLSYGAAAASYAENIAPENTSQSSLKKHYGISEAVERVLEERHIKSDAWTVDTFYNERLSAEDALSRLMLRRQLQGHANVADGFERLPEAIVNLYRDRRPGKLQVAFA